MCKLFYIVCLDAEMILSSPLTDNIMIKPEKKKLKMGCQPNKYGEQMSNKESSLSLGRYI